VAESLNRTAAPFPADRSLVDLFDAQVRLIPDADAILWADRRLSYAALDGRSRRFAAALRTLGVGPDDRVGLCLHRTPDLIAAVLGTLMTGAAYVPLDPAYPPARLRFIAKDAGCRVVITQQSLSTLAAELASVPLVIDELDDAAPVTAVPHAAVSSSLAYVIYTSGSTGTPKGVAIEHRQVVNLVTWAAATFSPEELAGMLASTSMSFDLSVFEWFLPLCTGRTVILIDSLFALPQAPARDRVTFVNSVPAVVRELLRHDTLPESVAVVAMAGEALSQSLVAQVYGLPSVKKVFDLYGPTEATVYATCALRTVDGPTTIGRPIANTVALVLDAGGGCAGGCRQRYRVTLSAARRGMYWITFGRSKTGSCNAAHPLSRTKVKDHQR
jgi:amino acid adenylation domain-containing protein